MTINKASRQHKPVDPTNYYYDELPKSERLAFLMQWLRDHPNSKVDFVELFLDTPEYNNSDYNALISFRTVFSELRPAAYARQYEFVELKILEHAFFRKDEEQIHKSLEILSANPVSGIDTVVHKTLFQLLFKGYYKDALAFSESVWRPLSRSKKLMFSPEFHFVHLIYLDKLEQQFVRIQKGGTSGWGKFRKEIKSLGFDNSADRLDPIFKALRDGPGLLTAEIPFAENLDETLLKLNIHFLIYMRETYNLPFMLSDSFFNLLQTSDLYKDSKKHESLFYFPYVKLDRHIAGKCDSFFGSNILEIFGKTWGLHYVYEFLYRFKLIDEPWYSLMTQNLACLKRDFMLGFPDKLWQMGFVAQWPGKDIPGNLAVNEEFFRQLHGLPAESVQKIIRETIPELEGQNRIEDEVKADRIKKGKYRPPVDYISKDSSEPYYKNTPETGRNDPCPCGSGKKFKKCCMRQGV